MNCIRIFLFGAVWQYVNGCYNNQRVGFCPPKRKVFQAMCPGEDPWSCNYVELVCQCVKGTSRRKDGACVQPDQCDAAEKKPKPSDDKKEGGVVKETKPSEDKKKEAKEPPVQEPSTKEPALPAVEETLPSRGPLYYSGESHGCPARDDRCTSNCKALGFEFGLCDPIVSTYCYCGRSHAIAPSQMPQVDGRSYELHWPFGRLVGNGYLIRELKESHGCPDDEKKCFEECRRHRVMGAFCGEHKHCYCEASLPAHIWENSLQFDMDTDPKGIITCETRDICDAYCKALGYTGGYCPNSESDTCYCYEMFTYSAQFLKLLEDHSRNPRGINQREHVKHLIESNQRLVLVLISEPAWGDSKCECMESHLLLNQRDGAMRSVLCLLHGHEHTENVTLDVNTDSEDITTIKVSGALDKLPVALQGTYEVLMATVSCAVLQISDMVRGRPLCALWGTEDAKGKETEEEACLKTMTQVCMQPVIFMRTEKTDCAATSPGAVRETPTT